MNQILVEGGFTPEWILLQKEIQAQKEDIRLELSDKCYIFFKKSKSSGNDYKARSQWQDLLSYLRENSVKKLNKDIDKFNLMVPLLHVQTVHFNLDKEAKKVKFNILNNLENISDKEDIEKKEPDQFKEMDNFLASNLVKYVMDKLFKR